MKVTLLAPFGEQCGIAEYSELLALHLEPYMKVQKVNTLESAASHEGDILHYQYHPTRWNHTEVDNQLDGVEPKIITLHSRSNPPLKSFKHFISHIKQPDMFHIPQACMNFYPTVGWARTLVDGRRLGQPVIGMFGFMLPHKGYHEVIRMVPALKVDYPDIMLLVLAAYHPPNAEKSQQYYEFCQDIIKKLNLENDVKIINSFLPYGSINALLQLCDILVFNYTDVGEASSGAVRVALGTGKPIICSQAQMFDDVRDAIYQTDDIFDAIVTLLRDEALRIDYSKKSTRFAQTYSWDNIAKQHVEVYKKVLESQPVLLTGRGKNMRITVCTIASRGADYLKYALESVREVVDDYILILMTDLDTGEPPEPMLQEIAEYDLAGKPIKIQISNVKDTTGARDEYMKWLSPTCDWAFILDSDEIYVPDEIAELRDFLEGMEYDFFLVKHVNFGRNFTVVREQVSQARIFRRNIIDHYEIHELHGGHKLCDAQGNEVNACGLYKSSILPFWCYHFNGINPDKVRMKLRRYYKRQYPEKTSTKIEALIEEHQYFKGYNPPLPRMESVVTNPYILGIIEELKAMPARRE